MAFSIRFFEEEVTSGLSQKDIVKRWLKLVIESFDKKPGEVNFIFCSDDYLLKINQEFLDHDYYTDIITFNQSEDESEIAGDIYISVDRVKENAGSLAKTYENELHRVMVHGVLHLCGMKDESDDQKKEMRLKEDECLLILTIGT